MIGTIVKIILMIQAGIGLIVGLIIVFSPAFLTDSGVDLNFEGVLFLGIFVIAIEGFFLYGLSKLHEG